MTREERKLVEDLLSALDNWQLTARIEEAKARVRAALASPPTPAGEVQRVINAAAEIAAEPSAYVEDRDAQRERRDRVRRIRALASAHPPTPDSREGERTGTRGRTPGEIAEAFHVAYEALAPHFSYRTREASAVPWAEVPQPNRDLMVATVRAVLFEPAPSTPEAPRGEEGP